VPHSKGTTTNKLNLRKKELCKKESSNKRATDHDKNASRIKDIEK
jgi:hypothetical protein